MRISLDTAMLTRTTQDAIKRLRAVRQTVERAGAGEVIVSRRAKLAGEKGRQLHGRAIANMLMDSGHDPFAYDRTELEAAARTVSQGTARAIQMAWAIGRHQQAEIKALFLGVAQELSMWAKRHILAGGLGDVKASTARQKERLARKGLALPGHIHHRGVRSGRFADGFRWRWRSGRRTA